MISKVPDWNSTAMQGDQETPVDPTIPKLDTKTPTGDMSALENLCVTARRYQGIKDTAGARTGDHTRPHTTCLMSPADRGNVYMT